VLANLIRNSLEALKEADPAPAFPALHVSAQQEGSSAIIRVSDNGPGVPAGVRPNLFKAFHTTGKADGNGLGLVISAELIRAHGGDIALDDTPAGAVFVIRLPAASPGERGSAETSGFEGPLAQDRFSR
jgi:C4-dicarboxylate-specific signal transduction histidine kinase